MKEYSLEFIGYFRDAVIDTELPHESGIYLVYRGVNINPQKCQLNELIYIGETSDIHDRHIKDGQYVHEHHQDFLNVCQEGETPYYAYAKLLGGKEDRQRVEAAMIKQTRPCVNSSNTKSFNNPETIVNVFGRHESVDDRIVMK